MGKVDSYKVNKAGFQNQEFADDVTELLNFGHYASPVVTSVPAWNAGEGEFAFYNVVTPATDRRIYVRLYSSWVVFSQILGTGSGPASTSPGGPEGAIQYNSGGVFQGNSGAIYYQASGTTVLTGSSTGTITPLLLINSQAYATDLTDSNVALDFGFVGTDSLVARIVASKQEDYTSPTLKDTFIGFHTISDDQMGERFRVFEMGFISGTIPSLTTTASNFPRFLLFDSGGRTGNFNVLQVNMNDFNKVRPIFHIGGNVGVGAVGHVTIGSNGPTGTFDILSIVTGQPQIGFTDIGDGDIAARISFNDSSNSAMVILRTDLHAAANGVLGSNYDQYYEQLIWPSYLYKPGYLMLRNSPPNPRFLTREMPLLHTLPGTYLFNSGNTITNQRFYIFSSGSVAANGTPALSITNLSTVYIQGAPVVGNSINATNRYAIWVDDGDVRIDGNLIGVNFLVGGGTTSRAVGTFFTTSSIHVSSNSTTENELIRAIVGTTSLVANTLSEGRTIRLTASGYYNTPAVPDTLTVRIKLGGVQILSTGAQTPTANASTFGWSLDSLITCQATGGAGSVIGQGIFETGSTLVGTIADWRMVNSTNVTLDTTVANIVELTAQWGGTQAAEQLYATNVVGELLN